MQRDMKIGMFVGLVLAAGVMVYVCTRPGLSPRARMLRQNSRTLLSEVPPQSSADSQPLDSGSGRTQTMSSQPEQISSPVQIQPQPVNDGPAEVVYVEKPYKTQKFYIVRRGDTLSKISKKYYGDSNDWHRIYDANRDVLENPDMLKPGMKLTIPN
jgi:nucleoid-associated protein YgaU